MNGDVHGTRGLGQTLLRVIENRTWRNNKASLGWGDLGGNKRYRVSFSCFGGKIFGERISPDTCDFSFEEFEFNQKLGIVHITPKKLLREGPNHSLFACKMVSGNF